MRFDCDVPWDRGPFLPHPSARGRFPGIPRVGGIFRPALLLGLLLSTVAVAVPLVVDGCDGCRCDVGSEGGPAAAPVYPPGPAQRQGSPLAPAAPRRPSHHGRDRVQPVQNHQRRVLKTEWWCPHLQDRAAGFVIFVMPMYIARPRRLRSGAASMLLPSSSSGRKPLLFERLHTNLHTKPAHGFVRAGVQGAVHAHPCTVPCQASGLNKAHLYTDRAPHARFATRTHPPPPTPHPLAPL